MQSCGVAQMLSPLCKHITPADHRVVGAADMLLC
jgi:hypothetical protein